MVRCGRAQGLRPACRPPPPPDPRTSLAANNTPGNAWVYQNTYADLRLLGRVIDNAMAAAGIPPMTPQQQQSVGAVAGGTGAAGRRLRGTRL